MSVALAKKSLTTCAASSSLRNADREHHRFQAGELQTTLQLIGRFIVQQPLVPPLPPEDELAGKEQAARKLGGDLAARSEEHTSELQSRLHLVCRLLLEKNNHDQSKNYLDKEEITNACLRIKSKWTAGGK